LGKRVSCAKMGGPILTIKTIYDVFLHKTVPVGDRDVTTPNLWGKIFQKAPFWARLGIFKPNSLNINTCIEITALIAAKFCTVIPSIFNTGRGWSKRAITNPRWRTAAILKNRKISQQWFDQSTRILHNDAH